MSIIKKLCALALMCVSAIAPAQADTLDKVLSKGKIRVGVLLDAPPWGLKDRSGDATGLDVDLAKVIAHDLNAELELVSLTGASRIPSLLANKVDILIAAAGATPERAQQVMFSQPYAAVSLGIYGSNVAVRATDISELAGKTVSVAKGSTLDIWLTDNAPDVKIVRFEDTPSAITAFLAGQVNYFAENSSIAMNVRVDNPDKNVGQAFLIRQSPAHIVVRQGDQNLLNWINTSLFYNRLSGKLTELQKLWFKEVQELPQM